MAGSSNSDSKLAAAIERFVFNNRIPFLIFIGVVTLVMLYFAVQLRVDAGFKKQLPSQHEFIQTFLDHEEAFGGANRILVAVMDKSGNMFNAEYFKAMEKVTNAVKGVQKVNSGTVRSIFTPNTRFVEIVEDGFAGGEVIPPNFAPSAEGFAPTQEDFDRIRSNIVKANIVGRLVAKEFNGAMVMAELVPESAVAERGEKINYRAIADELEDIRTQYQQGNVEIHIIGFAKIVGDISDGAKSVVSFFAVCMVLTIILLYFYSGSFKLGLETTLVSVLAVIWMMGALRLLGFGIDPMNILTPFLVFAVGVSHAVQMTSSWLSERLFGGEEDLNKMAAAQGFSSEEAARRSFRRLLIPGTVALMSDLIGFAVIYFIDIQIIRELAITACVGMFAIVFTNLLLHPILLSYTKLKNFDQFRQKKIDTAPRFDWFWRLLAKTSNPVPAAIIILCAVGIAFWGWETAKLMKIGDSEAGVPELRPDSRFNVDARVISSNFALGIDIINVIAETDKQACTDSYDANELIDRFAWHMQNIPGVQQVITLPSVSKILNAGWNEGNIRWRVIPRNKYVQRQNLQNVETDSGLLNTDCSAMPIQIFLTDHKAETLSRVVAEVKKFREDPANRAKNVSLRLESAKLEEQSVAAGEEFQPRGEAYLRLATGSAGVMAATNETVKAAEKPMLLGVYLAVMILCLLTYRSVLATVCMVLPLMLVSLLANALMAKLGIGLKVNTLTVAALGVGIGVDYAIYLYSRMRELLDRGVSLSEAHFDALKHTGTAVLFTAVTLSIGVGTWIFSELKFQADMGVLLGFMFLMNMVGALVLLPALLRWVMYPRQKVTVP
jgi:uncharacterized protein